MRQDKVAYSQETRKVILSLDKIRKVGFWCTEGQGQVSGGK